MRLSTRVPAQVTQWPQRLLLTALVVVLVGLVVWGMRRGWLGRLRRQGDIPDLPAMPSGGLVLLGPFPGRYLATAMAENWMDRIAVHGLGVRSAVTVAVRNDGVLLARVAAPDVFIPSDRLVEVRLDRAIAGSGYEPGGVLIFQWRHGDRLLDTGVRLTRTDLHPAVASATAPLIPETVAGGLE